MWVKKQLLQQANSPFNGQIEVIRQFGSVRIEVGGLLQSGGVLKQIWRRALKGVNLDHRPSKNFKILVLGLGGGTVIKLANQLWPQAEMVAVEIDPAMIKIARKHFGINEIKNLTIINQDVFKYCFPTNAYNLILVDLYQGDQFPKSAESLKFLKAVKTALCSRGMVVFNRLFYGQKRPAVESFIKQLDKVFKQIKLKRVLSNLMIYCQS